MFSPFSDREKSVGLLPRWARWIVLLVAPTGVGGLLFGTSDLFFGRPGRAKSTERRFLQALHDSKDPYWKTIKLRFVVGSLLGAGAGSACIAWCIVKREEL
jgi:hypothetical protein